MRVVKWKDFVAAACYCNSLKFKKELDYVVVKPGIEVPEERPDEMSEKEFAECYVFFGKRK